MRITLFAGTIALAIAPIVTLAASPSGIPVHRPAIAPLRGSAPTSDRSAYGRTFKLHFDLNTAPKPRAFDEPMVTFPRFLPAPACFANGVPTSQWIPTRASNALPSGETLGSLVDARSRHLFASKPGQATQLPLRDVSALTASPLTIQYGVAPLTCGSPVIMGPPLR
jgi:hypothetical protein